MEAEHCARQIVNKLVSEGYTAYYAGGWVRDFVMQHASSDIDIATNAPPPKILDLFPRTIRVGLAFGVVIVAMEGHQFEVSTFRRDLAYQGGRRPSAIEFCDAREDAIRRDFTINGMFYDPIEEKIIDYVGGREDIERGVIRTIGDPQERFFEDRLRMIRAVRFASRFGFQIDLDTQQAIIENADTLFPAVAMERVWQEFNKMAAYPRFDHALIELHRLGLLPVIFPLLRETHLRDLKHKIIAYPHFPQETPTIWKLMELFPSASLETQKEIGQYLRISSRDISLIEFIYRMRQMIDKESKDHRVAIDLKAWAEFYAHPLSWTALEVIAARSIDGDREALLNLHGKRRKVLEPHIERIKLKKTVVNPDQLKALGVPQGKLLGDLLREAEKIAIAENLLEEEAIIKLLKKSPLWDKFEKDTCAKKNS